jgi:hypothetical protein
MAELMDHEAARDWIDEAFLAPGMRDDDDTAARAVRAHLGTCAECAAYDEATRRAALKLDMARGPSPEVRTRTLAAAQRLARARAGAAGSAAAPHRSGGGLTWRLAAALVLIVAVLGAGAGAWWANAARQDSDHLADAVAMVSTLANSPGAHEVVLRDAEGTGNGIAVMSEASHELAVLATHLPAGIAYHCYLERAGQRTWIGHMYVDRGIQYWAGAMDSSMEMQPGDVLVVAADESAPAVLTATL